MKFKTAAIRSSLQTRKKAKQLLSEAGMPYIRVFIWPLDC